MLSREDHGAIVRLTLDDPARLNALSDAMLGALSEALHEIAADDHVRVVVLAATGRAFCAGHDLREMQAARTAPDGGRAAFADLFRRCADVMLAISHLPQPVIAEVRGTAVAAGCQLVAACDLALAGEAARFGVNGVNIGLFCSTPAVPVSRAIGPRAAFELLATGRLITAGEAAAAGLVNRAVPDSRLTEETMALAAAIASKLPAAIRIGKRAFRAQIAQPIEEAYALASAAMVENLMEPDTADGISAFLDKRSTGRPRSG